MRQMLKWLRALIRQTIFSIWWILSALSTISTFFVAGWSGRARLASIISTVVGFGWANFRVFQQQQAQIEDLEKSLSQLSEKTSRLRIVPDGQSHYILRPTQNLARADFDSIFLDLHLSIENSGPRRADVNLYQIELIELKETFDAVEPQEGRNGIQGRHCLHGLDPRRSISRSRIVRIEAESVTDHGTLLFFIPGITLERFVNAGMQMHGEQRRFGLLHCRLTVTDMVGSSASCEFELTEI